MSRGQKPRQPRYFPRMKVRGRRRRAAASYVPLPVISFDGFDIGGGSTPAPPGGVAGASGVRVFFAPVGSPVPSVTAMAAVHGRPFMRDYLEVR